MRSFQNDYQYGIQNEKVVMPILERTFNENFEKTAKFHPLDFKGRGCWVEVKSRTFDVGKFETTMLPYSKIEYAQKCENSVYFVFVFTDGIYYIMYDPVVFSKFSVNVFQRSGRTDHRDIAQQYIYIPTNLLTKIQ
jgi:hypothetical protein